ncbi:MAG: hypothetical protein RLP02_13095 [Coleofasciculus sp. C2-GNP5-27]
MNIDKLNQWLALLGNFGVIVGIIFLAVEIRQNESILSSEMTMSELSATGLAYDFNDEWRTLLLEHDDLRQLWNKGLASNDLSEDELDRFDLLCLKYLWGNVTTYERNSVVGRDEIADSQIARLSTIINRNPGFRDCWDRLAPNIAGYTYQTFVDRLNSALLQ